MRAFKRKIYVFQINLNNKIMSFLSNISRGLRMRNMKLFHKKIKTYTPEERLESWRMTLERIKELAPKLSTKEFGDCDYDCNDDDYYDYGEIPADELSPEVYREGVDE